MSEDRFGIEKIEIENRDFVISEVVLAVMNRFNLRLKHHLEVNSQCVGEGLYEIFVHAPGDWGKGSRIYFRMTSHNEGGWTAGGGDACFFYDPVATHGVPPTMHNKFVNFVLERKHPDWNPRRKANVPHYRIRDVKYKYKRKRAA